MVFPGHFSTGCLRCRQRKVKCDEGKPSCKRCQRYGKECTGYTDQFHFRYTSTTKLETSPSAPIASVSRPRARSSTIVRKSRQKSVAQSEEPAVATDKKLPPQSDAPEKSALVSSHIARPPSPSYHHVSLCYFINRFVSPGGLDSFPGHLSFLPSLYNHSSHGILETATLSVANMAAYNQFGGDKFRAQSYAEYGRTLRMMQDILKVEDQATDDKVIAAVLLLCTLEDIRGERPSVDNEHASGLFYLLEKRGLEQLVTGRGTELLLLGLLRLQIYSFMRDDDQYSDPGGIVTLLAPFNPLFRALSIMSKSLSLRKTLLLCATVISASAGQMTHQVDFALRDGQRTLQSCFSMLADFDELDHDAAEYWRDNFEGRSVPASLGRVSEAGAFLDAETACVVILLRAARLSLLVSMLQWHDTAMRSPENAVSRDKRLEVLLGDGEAWAACAALLERDVVKTINDILASVPFAFGDVDPSGLPTAIPYDGAAAIVILHSIRLLTYCPYATPDQLQKVRGILDRMNGSVGIRSAVTMSDAGIIRWVPYETRKRMLSCASASGLQGEACTTGAALQKQLSTSMDNGSHGMEDPMGFTY